MSTPRRDETCTKCNGKMTPNASGVCVRCRKITCARCGDDFQAKAENLGAKHCTPCRQAILRAARAAS
jgi:hypothetical protein